jgi:uncharacterized protein (DUF488 family)
LSQSTFALPRPASYLSGMPRKTFFTVGYERTTLAGLIAALEDHGVTRVIDTRDVANSRRAGFSKKLLAASLDEAGIQYIHLRALEEKGLKRREIGFESS